MEDLKGKVALVTGSTSGIGQATAVTLAKYGTKVTVSGRDITRGNEVVAEIAAAGGDAIFVQADLSDPEAPARLIEQTIQYWGKLNIVINNAAGVCNKPMEDLTHSDWDRLFAINMKAPFFITQAALPWLIASQGVILNISSTNSWFNETDNVVYDSLKAGLNHLSRGMSMDLRSKGVRVNVIMPGGVETPLLLKFFEQRQDTKEEALKTYKEVVNLDQVAQPQQIADLIALMASDRSAWVNGAQIPVDGGYFIDKDFRLQQVEGSYLTIK